jgi:hypothetical protein
MREAQGRTVDQGATSAGLGISWSNAIRKVGMRRGLSVESTQGTPETRVVGLGADQTETRSREVGASQPSWEASWGAVVLSRRHVGLRAPSWPLTTGQTNGNDTINRCSRPCGLRCGLPVNLGPYRDDCLSIQSRGTPLTAGGITVCRSVVAEFAAINSTDSSPDGPLP